MSSLAYELHYREIDNKVYEQFFIETCDKVKEILK